MVGLMVKIPTEADDVIGCSDDAVGVMGASVCGGHRVVVRCVGVAF
jgi:hypothetical protein